MFHKRLLNEFRDNVKYVVGMVAPQWVSLIANVVLMLLIAAVVSSYIEPRMHISGAHLLLAFVIVFAVRMAATTLNTRFSFAAS